MSGFQQGALKEKSRFIQVALDAFPLFHSHLHGIHASQSTAIHLA